MRTESLGRQSVGGSEKVEYLEDTMLLGHWRFRGVEWPKEGGSNGASGRLLNGLECDPGMAPCRSTEGVGSRSSDSAPGRSVFVPGYYSQTSVTLRHAIDGRVSDSALTVSGPVVSVLSQ